ncbi:MAG TPA: hypothetical protein VHK90_04510, partial [Thermoanaerobaculia bacterium]|nr:hypothetical protein [Thermoanaerobaculia bacterium]
MRFRSCGVALLLLSLASVVTPSNAEDAAALHLVVTRQTVSVRDAAASGQVLFVGYERSRRNYKLRLHHHRAVLRADVAGAVSLSPRDGIQPNSIWAAVDLSSGRIGTAAPDAATLRIAA